MGMKLHGDDRAEALAQDVLGGLLGQTFLAAALAAAGAGFPRGLAFLAVLRLPGLSLLLPAALLTDVGNARLVETDAPIARGLEVAFDLGGVTIRTGDGTARIDAAAVGTVGWSSRDQWLRAHHCFLMLLRRRIPN